MWATSGVLCVLIIYGMFGRTACIEMRSSKLSDVAERRMGLAEQTKVNMKMLCELALL